MLRQKTECSMTGIKTFTFNPFETNCYVCYDGREAVLVDPSCHTAAEFEEVALFLSARRLTLRHLLLTHAHIDHVFGCAHFAHRFGMDWKMHRDDVPLITRSEEQAVLFGLPLERTPAPQSFLQEGDKVRFGEAEWAVLHTPGHSPGSICFVDAASGFVVSGDVLFWDSIGRTDLPGGSLPILMRSIFQKLLPLGGDTAVYPGHGPATTIGREKQRNPFLL